MEEKKTYFAPGTVFEGTISAPGDVQVDGEVRGEIVSEGKVSIHKMGDVSIAARDLELLGAAIKGDLIVGGEVTVDADSVVEGNIRSASIICGGAVKGNLTASAFVSLGEGARIAGNITAPAMDVGNGALIRGELRIGDEASGGAAL